MPNLKKIGIIICFFGKLPWYFKYFLHSARYNPTIDFFVMSDDPALEKKLAINIKAAYLTLGQFRSLTTQTLGFQTAIANPYKVCDFKPAFGLIFSGLLENYDFWGYADIDIILGDIRQFITDEVLTKFDVISVRNDYLTGYFQLYRNNTLMKSLFMHSKDYERVFTTDAHFCFDETNFEFRAFSAGKKYTEAISSIESMMHVIKRLEESGVVNAYFDFHAAEGLPGRLKWVKGKLYYLNRVEVILYHMIHFKNICHPVKEISAIPDTFFISPSRIYFNSLNNLK